MKKHPILNRLLAAYLPIDLFFTASVGFAHYSLFDLPDSDGYLLPYVLAFLVRFGAWVALSVAYLTPERRLQATSDRASDSEILAATRRVDGSKLVLALAYGLAWGLKVILLSLWMAWGYPAPEAISEFSVHGGLLMALAVAPGAMVFSYPLVSVITADRAAHLHRACKERGIDPQLPPSSLQTRIGLLALGLAAAPTAFVAALGYTGAGLGGFDVAERDARSAARALATEVADQPAGTTIPIESAAARLDVEGARLALVDDAGRVLARTGASTLPANGHAREWLRSHVTDTRSAVRSLRGSGSAMAFRRVGDGRVAVAMVDTSHDTAQTFLFMALGFFATVLVWAPLAAVLFSRAVVTPIENVTRAVRRLVEEGRLEDIGAVPVVQRDEVGQLGEDFNALLDMLRDLSSAAESIADGDLATEVDGRGDLPDAFRGMLESLRGMVRQMNDTAVQLGSAASEIFAATQEQEMAATTQSSSMQEISQTMESLSQSAAHVSEAVEGVLSNAERTLQMTDTMVERIGELSRHANRIGEILEVIREIADRSDLLALNGSLEASHAGDAGRGFALVASEMRRLAERVTSSVHDVRNLVGDIRESGSSTVMATEESKKLADATTDAARQITLVSQQQRSSTEQVSESVRELTEVVSQTVAATSQTRASAENLKDQADQLSHLVQRFQTARSEVAA
ncbi:MAG: methyl-accepting chemotaxis protein [Myxococcota bacterium]